MGGWRPRSLQRCSSGYAIRRRPWSVSRPATVCGQIIQGFNLGGRMGSVPGGHTRGHALRLKRFLTPFQEGISVNVAFIFAVDVHLERAVGCPNFVDQ